MKNTNHKLTPVEEAALYFYPYAVLDMMAEDYESRQRKKNKFGGGTSNRKDPYEEQEDINGYNYVGKGDMRGLYQVPNSSEYRGYWTADGHPIGINEEGNLVDQITGETGILNLPEITVTGTEKPHTYATSMSANLPLGPTIFNPKEVQEPTLGQKAKAVEDVSRGMRVLSPAAWMDTAYDAMYTPDDINFPWMEGNQGLGDPALDFLFDAGVYGGLSKGVEAGAKGVSMANDYAKGVAQRYTLATKPNVDIYDYFKQSMNTPFTLNDKTSQIDDYFYTRIFEKPQKGRGWIEYQSKNAPGVGGMVLQGDPTANLDLIGHTSPMAKAKAAHQLLEIMPDYGTIASFTDVKVASQLSKWDKLKYVLANKGASKIVNHDYSLDVAKMLKSMYERPRPGIEVEISPNTVMKSTNRYSQNFENTFGKEFGNGLFDFEKLTPQQVAQWNSKYGEKYGFIDPETRTMPFYVVRKMPKKSSKKK